MDRGAWWATVHLVAKSGMTKQQGTHIIIAAAISLIFRKPYII